MSDSRFLTGVGSSELVAMLPNLMIIVRLENIQYCRTIPNVDGSTEFEVVLIMY